MEASYAQTSFLGGEISQWAQGRYDMPRYKIALAKALNTLIVDEGAAPRRPGFQFLGTSRNGSPGRVMPFDFEELSPYNLEFTDGFLRMWNGTVLVDTNDDQIVASISNTSPAVFTLNTEVTWVTGDQVYFSFSTPQQAVQGNVLLNRQFVLTMLSPTSFTVVDSVSGQEIDASMLGATSSVSMTFGGSFSSAPVSDASISSSPITRTATSFVSPIVHHISQIETPYTVAGKDWHSIRAVQGLELSILLHPAVAPQALEVINLPTDTEFATFDYSTAAFQDGPYLDPPPNAIATPSGLSGVIQVVVGYSAWVNTTVYGYNVPVTYLGQDYISLTNNNQGNTPSTSTSAWLPLPLGGMISSKGFVSTDVGRMMRLFSAPQNWLPGTTYAAGDNVTYNGSYFTSLANSNTNNAPDISTTKWVINPSGAIYSWGTITAVLSANQVSLQLRGANLLYTTPCPSFRIGAWSDTTGWPTCGCYQGGRFWFGGAIANRFDTSSSNAPFIMSPTQPDGTVIDSNGITYTLNSNSVDKFLWMKPNSQGVLIGTQKGEYLVSAGANGGPITPSNIADSPLTKYGSANMEPAHTGLTLCFVQRYQRRLLEYLNDTFNASRFYGPDLMTFARHLGKRVFKELAFQQEPAPIVWGRMGDGSLIGTTYRRISLFLNQDPEFNAWHQHKLGSNRLVESICVGPSNGGILDTLAMVTNDPQTNIRFIESLTPLMDETDPLTSAFFLDSAVTPQAATVVNYGGRSYVRFYGLTYLNGRKVSIFAAAIDCGDYFVNSGYADVPLGTLDPISGYAFDYPQFDLLQPLTSTFENLAVDIVDASTLYSIPCVIGFNYQTQGQLCRPVMPADTGARTGPGFAKKKRTARYGINTVESLGVQVGTNFNKMIPVPVASPLGSLPPYLSMFSGIKRETLPNDFSFDSMLCWQTTRPFPATVTTFGGFINTEDV